jgi:hypothetical protein
MGSAKIAAAMLNRWSGASLESGISSGSRM